MSEQKFPRQQNASGSESEMQPRPEYQREGGSAAGRLEGRTAIVTGGDSGIGRAVAVAFAREGADVAIAYLEQHQDAEETRCEVERQGRRCLPLAGDVSDEAFCRRVVDRTVREFGHLDVLVNNAGTQEVRSSIDEISREQIELTFRTNVFSQFFMVQAALPHLSEGSCIINTASVTAYKGNPTLLDYSSSKGAVVSFTRSLSQGLAEKGIRVNAVAPGPVWTPLIPATFPPDRVEEFGKNVALGRAGQPDEIAPCYVFLASQDAAYMTGQVLHPNGGTIING